jgi:hypothetical protein
LVCFSSINLSMFCSISKSHQSSGTAFSYWVWCHRGLSARKCCAARDLWKVKELALGLLGVSGSDIQVLPGSGEQWLRWLHHWKSIFQQLCSRFDPSGLMSLGGVVKWRTLHAGLERTEQVSKVPSSTLLYRRCRLSFHQSIRWAHRKGLSLMYWLMLLLSFMILYRELRPLFSSVLFVIMY